HFPSQDRQGKKYVVANPKRKRPVPAGPEDRRRGGCEGPGKVFRHGEAKDLRGPDGDVRAAGKIEEDMADITKCQTPNVGPAPASQMIEAAVDSLSAQDALAQELGHLHHQHTGRNATQSASEVVP